MDEQLSEIKRHEVVAQSKLRKEYDKKLFIDQALKDKNEEKIVKLQSQTDFIREERNETVDKVVIQIGETVEKLEPKFSHIIDSMLNENRAIQAATESRIQNLLRNMIEKVRDEIAGQLREIERDQIRHLEFDHNPQVTAERLDAVEKDIEQYNRILESLTDVITQREPHASYRVEPDVKIHESAAFGNSTPDLEKRLLDTVTEVTKFQRNFGKR
jgi:hypothetical protein